VLLNLLLHFVIVRPVVRMSRLAADVSLGKPDVPELTVSGSDEIAALSASFNRMRRSFEGALKMLPKS
jgi:protein-histidine pros-kinase